MDTMDSESSSVTHAMDGRAARVMRCPFCGRVSSVAEWVKRPICVHAWEGGTPEIWDGDDTDGEGQPIEQSQNPEYRHPGPRTWIEMLPAEVQP